MRTASEVSALVDGVLHGPDRAWARLAPLHEATGDDLAFHDRGDPGLAGVLLTRAPLPDRTCVVVADPLAAMCALVEHLHPVTHPPRHPGVVVGEGCEVGEGTVLFPNVVLYPGTRVGKRCRVHAGTVIGGDGFRFHRGRKVPHVGGVVIGDDCEIGANCTIDRGFLAPTTLGDRCRLDDQVHVGHNVRIGDDVYVAAQTGISGSVTIGSGTVIGGQVGIADHATIGRNVRIAAQSGVHGDVPDGATILGTPARPLAQMRRIYAALRYLPDLVRKS
ncbi:MAG: UDP-3-O-(3-hydroxymyristoyl)glucosamine N-acyltransferase [Myxococcota bacterium]